MKTGKDKSPYPSYDPPKQSAQISRPWRTSSTRLVRVALSEANCTVSCIQRLHKPSYSCFFFMGSSSCLRTCVTHWHAQVLYVPISYSLGSHPASWPGCLMLVNKTDRSGRWPSDLFHVAVESDCHHRNMDGVEGHSSQHGQCCNSLQHGQCCGHLRLV